MRQKAVILIPTYNERATLGPLVEALQAQRPRIPYDVVILVIDDSSPDGTAEVARAANARWGNVHLLSGKRSGLGIAYVRGIRHAIEQLGADVIVQMDADGSHDPADVPRLLAALEQNDVVIGSRYVQGGRVAQDWGAIRRAISLGANTAARFIAGLYRVRDCTNGFRASRASAFQLINLQRAPRGYAVLLYLLYHAERSGARVHEVPVTFSNRSHGRSKLRRRDAIEYLTNSWWIRYDRPARAASGGLSGVAVSMMTFGALVSVGTVPLIGASALAVELSVLASFGWRALWEVATDRRVGQQLGRLSRYQFLSTPSMLLTVGVFALSQAVLGLDPLVAHGSGVSAAVLCNYLIGDRMYTTSSELMARARRSWFTVVPASQRPAETRATSAARKEAA